MYIQFSIAYTSILRLQHHRSINCVFHNKNIWFCTIKTNRQNLTTINYCSLLMDLRQQIICLSSNLKNDNLSARIVAQERCPIKVINFADILRSQGEKRQTLGWVTTATSTEIFIDRCTVEAKASHCSPHVNGSALPSQLLC